MPSAQIVIIGSGMAAYMLAIELRLISQTASVMMITEGDGEYYPKPKLSTLLFNKTSAKDIVTGTAEYMSERYRLEVVVNQSVVAVDRSAKQIKTSNGLCVGYDYLVFATGSLSRQLPGQDGLSGIFSINSLSDYHQWSQVAVRSRPESITIVGSGLVGIEFAHDFLSHGYQVKMISDHDNPLSQFVPELMGERILQHLKQMGLQWLSVPDGVTACAQKDNQIVLSLSDHTMITSEMVLVAIGLQGRVELAKRSGLACTSGIVCDNFGKTSDSSIFALGDCAVVHGQSRYFVAPLRQQAKSIAQTLLGNPVQIHYPVMPAVLKMPSLPVSFVAPSPLCQGQWRVESNDKDDLEAGFLNTSGDVVGFALLGKKAMLKRASWSERIMMEHLDE
ncbi:MAG: FAD-dependent oxidoreductase [Pseudomonadota bacterium]|nr:FAD-dependent oxidoreductase [Pseudomonadota bacterium]